MRISTPPSDFGGRAGRCGVQSLPSLNSGLPLSISADSASTVAVTPDVDVSLAASSRDTSRPATGLRPAAARVFGSVEPPMEVPRADLLPTISTLPFLPAFFGAASSSAPAALRAALEAAISTVLRCLPALEAICRWVSKAEASASASSRFTQSETLPKAAHQRKVPAALLRNRTEWRASAGHSSELWSWRGIWRESAGK